MKGKCFSMINRGQRKESDCYCTPLSMTQQLLNQEYFNPYLEILEPACGDRAITKVLEKNSFRVFSYDIKSNHNFLEMKERYAQIITNPPFSLAHEFIIQCKKIATHKFALLLPLSYLHGQRRYEDKIFTDEKYPLSKIYVFTRYPLLTSEVREDGKYETGMMAYAWFVWEKDELPPASIHWIDNQKYVLKKGATT